ncbi:MAG: dihydroorotase [Elusimicrobia bacterium]|nr:dihydroorotase [Elusimicrobiota bacterium]
MTLVLLIRDGLVVDPSRKIEARLDVLLEDGKVAAVGRGLSAKSAFKGMPSLDAKGCWVVPGLIDLHVHLREPGGEVAETIASGAQAAARGGFTTVLAMPNTKPPVDDPALLADLRARAAHAPVRVLFAGAVTEGQGGRVLTRLEALAKAGAAAFSDDGRPVRDPDLMSRALARARDLGLPILSHCEDPDLLGDGVMNEGPEADRRGLKGIPRACETVMVCRDVALAEATGGRLHICHASAAGTVTSLRLAKARGTPVTGEAAPHHWTLCDQDIPGRDPDYKMNPPLRSASDRDAVRDGLADGTIDAIASDHAPHPRAAKALGFEAAPFGIIGLETSVGLAMTVLLGKGLTPSALVDRMSAAPARILGLKSRGSLAVGMDADVAVIDPRLSWTVKPPFASKSSNTPFMGMRLKGRVRATIVAGRLVHAL